MAKNRLCCGVDRFGLLGGPTTFVDPQSPQ
jgi:hypothetical protein